jgi:DNA-binding transcriptional LysR family regulator
MELRHVRYFLAVAEEGNVTRAAEKLGIGQPPLSQQIHALEDEIGVRLFRRTGHGVLLTEAGQAFMLDARRLMADATLAVHNAQRAGKGEIGQLNIGFTGSAVFNPVVSNLIRKFRQEYPDVNLTLVEGNTERLLAEMNEGRLDVAFVRPGSQSPASFMFHEIAIESMKLVLPATHPLASRKKIALQKLANEPFVLLPRNASPTLHDVIVGACRNAGFEPNPGQEAPQLSSVVNLVAAEFGVSLVPASVCQIRVDGVVYADVQGPAIKIRLALAFRRDRTAGKIANFIAAAGGSLPMLDR